MAHTLHVGGLPLLFYLTVLLIGYPRFPKTACILRLQLIYMQQFCEILLLPDLTVRGGGVVSCPSRSMLAILVNLRKRLYFRKFQSGLVSRGLSINFVSHEVRAEVRGHDRKL